MKQHQPINPQPGQQCELSGWEPGIRFLILSVGEAITYLRHIKTNRVLRAANWQVLGVKS